jgi:hypothetical protein
MNVEYRWGSYDATNVYFVNRVFYGVDAETVLDDIYAEKLIQINEMLLIQDSPIGENWTVYTTPAITPEREENRRENNDIVKFLEGIKEFFILGDAFVYKTAVGWFFFFMEGHSWHLGKKRVLEKRLASIPRICCSNAKVTPHKEIDPKRCVSISVDGKLFILYNSDPLTKDSYGKFNSYYVQL